MRTKVLGRAAAMAAVAWLAAVASHAQTVDERTFFTFSGAVELPGVALAPGKYLFHLPDPTNTRNVVQVLSADGSKVYGMFYTMRVERSDAASEPEVRFMETATGAPPPIRTYWIAGERTGREFIYPKEQAMRLAKYAGEPVLTTQARSTKTEETNTTALSRVSPTGTETAVAVNATPMAAPPAGASQKGERAPASLEIATTRVPLRAEGQVARASLPKTGSALPLVGLIGLGFVMLAGIVSLWRTQARVVHPAPADSASGSQGPQSV